MDEIEVKEILDLYYHRYHQKAFIEEDPIQIPLSFHSKQDQEISGLFAATFAWGQRKTIIAKTKELLNRMDNTPYEFILNSSEEDKKSILGFKHRTFNDTDALYYLDFLKRVYSKFNCLEDFIFEKENTVQGGLIHFKNSFENDPNFHKRTGKHLSSPLSGSACKRLNMYFRWMVRTNDIDLGIWTKIKPKDLICPLDVHVVRVANELQLMNTTKTNWKTATELTKKLAQFDPIDPVKYDFALFGLGVYKGEEM
jgi:uncharacterized protein (TIGR02757 family)